MMRALRRGLPPPPAARPDPRLALPATPLAPRLAPLAMLRDPRLALPAVLLSMRPVHVRMCGMTLSERVTQWIRLPRMRTLCSRRCWGGCLPGWQARLGVLGRSS
eukprot:9110134-Alexandrium_andersonii.AAC.1